MSSLAALFDETPLTDQPPKQPVVQRVVEQAPVVERVLVRPLATRTTHLTAAPESWDARRLQDFVVAEIQRRFGAFPRDAVREAATFKSFFGRWSERTIVYLGHEIPEAVAIAKYAFAPPQSGWWHDGKVTVNRFCKNADPYFAQPIVAALLDILEG